MFASFAESLPSDFLLHFIPSAFNLIAVAVVALLFTSIVKVLAPWTLAAELGASLVLYSFSVVLPFVQDPWSLGACGSRQCVVLPRSLLNILIPTTIPVLPRSKLLTLLSNSMCDVVQSANTFEASLEYVALADNKK